MDSLGNREIYIVKINNVPGAIVSLTHPTVVILRFIYDDVCYEKELASILTDLDDVD